MNKVLILIFGLILFTVSCNSCSTKMSVNVPASTKSATGFLEGDGELHRVKNKEYSDHLVERTVSVKFDCEGKEDIVILMEGSPSWKFDSRGTGVILRSYEEGSYIATAAHVVTLDNKKFKKGLDCSVYVQRDADANSGNNRMKATIIALDKNEDLAILRINEDLGIDSDLSKDNFVGEEVWSSGYGALKATRATQISITKGTLATLSITKGFGQKVHRVTCQIYSGNSGGPVWDRDGRLIGITLFMYGLPSSSGFMPKEGEYYIRPADEIARLATRRGVFDEIYKDI